MLMNNIDELLHISYDEICKKGPSVISQELIYDCTMINEFILNSTLPILLNICMFIFTLNTPMVRYTRTIFPSYARKFITKRKALYI